MFDMNTGQISVQDGRYWQRPEVRGAWRSSCRACAQPLPHHCAALLRASLTVRASSPPSPLTTPLLLPCPAPPPCRQVIESIFYMWRATHDRRWRDMGWRMWQAIEAHCRWEGGYSGALDVNQVGGGRTCCGGLTTTSASSTGQRPTPSTPSIA